MIDKIEELSVDIYVGGIPLNLCPDEQDVSCSSVWVNDSLVAFFDGTGFTNCSDFMDKDVLSILFYALL